MPRFWHIAFFYGVYHKGQDRLKSGGVEKKLSNSQFGFRPQRSTADALFLVRRMIDAAVADKHGELYLILLDWSKAFDRVKTPAMLNALQRFGIPGKMLRVIRSIYTDRVFFVRDWGVQSSQHPQSAGIAQGCPLSPYLFIIVMSILMTDVKASLSAAGYNATGGKPYLVTSDVVYADDTLLVSADLKTAERFLGLVAEVGEKYGLELNMRKTVAMVIGDDDASITGPDGQPVAKKDQTIYLGGLIAVDGRPTSEVSRRLGEARRNFESLTAIWAHAKIIKHRKQQIFQACVVTKLLYGLSSCWLLQADRSKLDAFYIRCLRRIHRIPHPMLSHISNQDVLQAAEVVPLSVQLFQQQLQLYGRLYREGADSLVRQIALEDDGCTPKQWQVRRRVGRPRLQWSSSVFALALKLAEGSLESLRAMLDNAQDWKNAVKQFEF